MKLDTFLMERFQSVHENSVEINLSESGVDPLSARELLGDADACDALLDKQLHYPQTNGTLPLRQALARLYPGATPEHVLVTNGGAEANMISLTTLIEPGDEVVLMVPNYMQVPGWANGLGARVRPWALVADSDAGRWRCDLEGLEELVTERTKLIALCHPNNPTGACLLEDELNFIAAVAERAGAWILADEIYRGAEISGVESPSMWGRYERTLITSGLSKAYGLPGLRLGWITGPSELVERCWETHDYTSIAPSMLSDTLAQVALEPHNRARLLSRTREHLRSNYDLLGGWLEENAHHTWHLPPEAGAMLFLRYSIEVNSTALVEHLRTKHSVLLVPGDYFGMDGYLRIGYGGTRDALSEGLRRLSVALEESIPS